MPTMRNGIIKRGKKYSYVIRERDPATGERRNRWVSGFSTHAEAKRAKDLAEAAQLNGQLVSRQDMLLIDFLREWLGSVDVRPKTLSGYRYNLEHYVKPRLGGTALQDVRPQLLTALYANLRADGGRNGAELGWRSVQSVHATLRSAMSFAVDQQYLATNPALRARLPPKPQQRRRLEDDGDHRVFNTDQLRRFLKHCQDRRLYAFFYLAGYTGARRGELLHLQWRDVDWDNRKLHLEGSRAVVDGAAVEGPTKGGRPRRISISAEDLSVLRAHRARQVAERLAAGELWRDGADYVFKTEIGAPLHPDIPSKLMRGFCVDAEVPVIRLHDLRHTHATILLTLNKPVHEVAQRLGHRDGTITMTTYAKVLQGRHAGLATAFATAMAPN